MADRLGEQLCSGETVPDGLAALVRTGSPAPVALRAGRRKAEALMAGRPLPPGVELDVGDAAGVPVLDLHRNGASGGPVLLYFHGGGYRLGSARAFAPLSAHLAMATQARVISVDYRLAPENPFPAALLDAVTAYRWLLTSGVSPERIVVGGDSAGGGLAAALLLRARHEGVALPAGAVLLSPWVDLRNGAGSFVGCAHTDELFSKSAADEAAAMYLADHPAHDPLASPVLGDWDGQPALLIQCSDSEVLCDDASLLSETARAAGVDVCREVYSRVPHVWHLAYPDLPEAAQAVSRIAAFVHRVTGGPVPAPADQPSS